MNALWAVIVLVALGSCIETSLKMCDALWVRTDTTIPEASIVYSIRSFFDPGYSLYRDYTVAPFTTTPYTPIYYLVAAVVSEFLGGSVYDTYLAGRCVSIAAFFLSLGLIYKIATNIGIRRASAGLASLFVCGTSIVYPWAVSCRPDFLALAFGLLGVYFVSRPETGQAGSPPTVLISWVLSFFCKQSFLSLPVSYFCFSILRGRMSDGARVLLTFVALVVGACFLIEVATVGNFLSNVITANVAPPDFRTAFHVTKEATLESFFLVFMCGVAGAMVIISSTNTARRMKSELGRFIAVAATVSTIYFTATTLKPGGAGNYFLEPLFLWAILAGALFDFLRDELGAFRRVAVLCVATFVWALPLLQISAADVEASRSSPFWEHEKFSEAVLSTPGDILFISNGFGLRLGRGTTLYDGFNASYLEEEGKIDLSSMAQRIQRQEFSALLIQSAPEYYGYSLTPRSLKMFIKQRYQRDFEIGPYQWMVPRAPLLSSVQQDW